MSNSSKARQGAGFAAAQTAAAAAAVIAQVARESSYSWSGATGAASQAASLADRLGVLAEENAEVFGAALTALANSSPDLATRLEAAAAVPLKIAETAADVAEAAALVALRCDGLLRADAVSAAALAAGASLAAAELVRANLVVADDDERVTRAFRAAEDASRAAARALDSGA